MSDITNYENLANAIILQAVKDYRVALKCLKVNPRNKTAFADKEEIVNTAVSIARLRTSRKMNCTSCSYRRSMNCLQRKGKFYPT